MRIITILDRSSFAKGGNMRCKGEGLRGEGGKMAPEAIGVFERMLGEIGDSDLFIFHIGVAAADNQTFFFEMGNDVF